MARALLVALCLAPAVLAAPAEDLVASLPGYGAPPAPQYSGFLNASTAPAVSGGGTHLHYWFAQYEGEDRAWTDAPVVLWLNGGPGSTSMLGFLQEEGPLLIGHDGALMRNPWAWTRVANLVAVESPGGVGYSYCDAMKAGTGDCAYDDKTTAKANEAAMRDFFSKFPELVGNEFIITGESYAGVYCPTLAKEILDGNEAGAQPPINLFAMAVGDPCTDNTAQADSMDMLWYGHKYGFVPDDDFDLLWNQCGTRARPAARRGGQPRGPPRLSRAAGSRARDAPSAAACDAAERKFLLTTSQGFSQTWTHAFVNDVSLYGPSALVRFDVPGTLDYKMAQWMMSDEVKAAIHVTESPAPAWPGPPDGWRYESSYAACSDIAEGDAPSMIDFYRELAPRLAGRVLVFNGDTDPCVSYEGTRTAIERVGFNVTNAYRPWFFNATAATVETLTEKDVLFGPSLTTEPAGPQLGGHIVDYEHGLSFATVHGSGHVAPQFRPRSSLVLIKHIVQNTSFAPDLPSDAELAAMEEDAFSSFLDEWTLSAQTTEFIAD